MPEQNDTTEMHDNCREVILFNNHVTKLMKSLKQQLPKIKTQIVDAYKTYKSMKRIDYINEAIKCMTPYAKNITKLDDIIFKDGKVVNMLPNLDFTIIWTALGEKYSYFKEQEKMEYNHSIKNIFSYLNILYVDGIEALKKSEVYAEKVKKNKKVFKRMINSMKLDAKVKQRMEELADDDEQDFSITNIISQMVEILGEDSLIIKFGKECIDILGLQDVDSDDINDIVYHLFGDSDSDKSQTTIKIVVDLFNKKMETGELNADIITEEVKKLQEKLKEHLGEDISSFIPDISSPEVMKEWIDKELDNLTQEEREVVMQVKDSFLNKSEETQENPELMSQFREIVMKYGMSKLSSITNIFGSDKTPAPKISTKPKKQIRKRRGKK